METVTNRDVWGYIVKYFRVSLSDDSAQDVKAKRRTLLSIALTRSELTAVAVSELWRSMKTLEPIIYAFNPPPFKVTSPAFEYKRDNSEYWEMVRTSNSLTKDVKWRVREYLSRVRYLHFPTSPSSKERALWQALQVFHWINPLCPNLCGITLTGGNYHPSMIYGLTPLLVPSLRSISFDSATTSCDEAAVSMLLGLIKHREVQISDILYAGYASRRVVAHIFQFPKLRSAKVLGNPNPIYHELLEASDIQFFRPSTLLTNLDIDLGIFQATVKVGSWIETLQSLSKLSLHGTASVVIDCFQERKFALVHSLTLFLREPYGMASTAPNIFAIIPAAFPILHSLCLETKYYNTTSATITLSDFHTLRERPMRCLVICGLQLSLSNSDVIDVLKTWPALERLSLVPLNDSSSKKNCAYQLLRYISRHAPCITELNIPLNMSSLITVQPLIATKTVCPLQRLGLTQVRNLPSRLEEQLILARNLVTLFPRLDILSSNNVRELQMIVKSLRGMLSSPPTRATTCIRRHNITFFSWNFL